MIPTGSIALLAALEVGPVEFDRPWWLLLLPIVLIYTVVIGRQSLAGLGGASRRTALIVRVLVISLLVAAMAEPSSRRTGENVAVTAVLDVSRSIDPAFQTEMESYLVEARSGHTQRTDRLGVVTVGEGAIVQTLPTAIADPTDRPFTQETEGTNLAAGVRIALAARPEDAANRLLIISDGNETEDSLLAAAQAASASGIPVDVLPIQFALEREVIAERLIAPGNARGGEAIALRVVLNATAPTSGRLSILLNDQPVDLDPEAGENGMRVELETGTNVFQVPVLPVRPGAQSFQAIFEPETNADGSSAGDVLVENNTARAVTFVGSEGFVLVVSDEPEAAEPLIESLNQSRIQSVFSTTEGMPTSLTEMNNYEAIVLMNTPAYAFSNATQETLRRYVHDTGGGLVVIGGPESFGAGGWIGSPLEEALPVRLDPPSKKQMPRGALVLIMHSIEMPQGVFYGKETARAAVEGLSRLDLVGIVEYMPFGGTDWVFPLTEKGDGAGVARAINNLTFGDMQDYGPTLNLTSNGLINVEAGQKHVILISDGDPTLNRRDLAPFKAAGISITTVGVFPHIASDFNRLRFMAEETGGTFYAVDTQAALVSLPEIFFKEAQVVSRSLIWEGDPFAPQIMNRSAETMRGLTTLPPISGYVVAAERAGLAVTTIRGQEEDPIAAQWQYGLGKVIAFTSDSASRWSPAWVAWDGYRAFWEQHLRWAMRPGGSANVRVTTETDGDRTAILVDVFDDEGERVTFSSIRGRVAGPRDDGAEIDLQAIGPGRYRAVVDTPDAGAYVMGLRYLMPGAGADAAPVEGTVRAAITRPFSDEFRALRDNSSLLRQVAEATGGRVLTGDPSADGLWEREGLTMPVATRPIWLAVAIASIGLFLIDVGVRRVRIDPALIGAFFKRGISKEQQAAAGDIGSLQAVRSRTRDRLGSSSDQATRTSGDDADAIQAPEPTAGRKFEADAAARSDASILSDDSSPAAKITRPGSGAAGSSASGTDSDEAGGLGRLFEAKRRAREELNDQNSSDDDQPTT